MHTHIHKRHNYMTTTLPTTNHAITLPIVMLLLNQYIQIITATHLVITVPTPRNVIWYILHTLKKRQWYPSPYSNNIMSTTYVYPLWTSNINFYDPLRSRTTNRTQHTTKFDYMSTHLTSPATPPSKFSNEEWLR